MAYNLRSRLTSTSAPEGSSVASMSEGLGLSPVEFAVPMSEQATAGHGPNPLGLPIVIEGSPEALQIAATLAPLASQVTIGQGTEPDIESDVERTKTLETTLVSPASSVCGAGAAGPPSISFGDSFPARDTTADVRDPSYNSQVPSNRLGDPSLYCEYS